jgi:hypothetical protein
VFVSLLFTLFIEYRQVVIFAKINNILILKFLFQLYNDIIKTLLAYSFKYNQQYATLYNILYYCRCSTYFGRFLRPSSGAQELYTQHLVRARLAAATASVVGLDVPVPLLAVNGFQI